MAVAITPSITLFERDDWGARHWRDYTDQGWNAHEVFIHHTDDSAAGLDSFRDQCARMQHYQNYHMDDPEHRWDDIGYHIVAFPEFNDVPARLFQGRPRNHVPAAQLGHNSGTLAIAVVAAGNARMTRNTRYAIGAYINWLKERGAPLTQLGGHRDVVSTSCPGDGIYNTDLPLLRDVTNLRRYS